MCPLCRDTVKVDVSHIKKCQSLTDNMDNAKNQDKWRNLSKLYWILGKKGGGGEVDIPLTAVG
jgi:hypothetical protein